MSDPLAEAARAALLALLPNQRVAELARLGRGHIHDTWVARCEGASEVARFVVQRINTAVFPDPEALAANLALVSERLARTLSARGVADPGRRCLRPVAGPSGATWYRDGAGRCWRAFPYLDNTRAFDVIDSPERAREAARAFGAFLADLDGLDPDALRVTIPRFHDLPKRLAALADAAERDPAGRAHIVTAELHTARRTARRVLRGADPAALPRRVVHNDCKLNNLLFDAQGREALCVVDLDTVMPGSALFDFGELVRTGACCAAEDERDLSRVQFDLGLFRPLAEGFTLGARDVLTGEEVRAFADAGPRMALENAVRFLTDHLEGDRYFRIAREDHNLDRARAQLHLVACMLEAEAEVRGILAPLANDAP